VRGVAAGLEHSLALQNDGSVWAWGGNSMGQLGDGTTADRHTPAQVSGGLTAAKEVAAGEQYSLALKADGSVWAWGGNQEGELGNGCLSNECKDERRPVQVVAGLPTPQQ
jgi:alpha-tubulin suppressor-like RCC1 family protein